MAKKIIILLIIITSIVILLKFTLLKSSCRDDILIGNGDKYWSYSFNNTRITSVQFKFFKDHTYVKYLYDLRTKKRKVTNDSKIHDDIVFPKQVWNFKSDSMLEFGEGVISKVIFLDRDSFALTGLNNKDTSIFYWVKE